MPTLPRVLLICLLGCSAAIGQTSPANDPPRDPLVTLRHVQEMLTTLDLTPVQREQLDPMFKQAKDDIQNAAPDLQNASADDRAARYREIMTDLRHGIAGVLSDEQKQSLQQKLQGARRSVVESAPTTKPTVTTSRPPAANQERGRGAQFLARLKANLAQLDLSDDQKKKIETVSDEVRDQLKALRNQAEAGSIPRGDIKDKIAAIVQDARSRFSEILTADQQAKLRSLTQQENAAAAAGASSPPSRPAQLSPATAPAKPTVAAAPAASSAPDVGQPAPDFKLKKFNGDSVELASSKHRLLVLVFGSLSAPVLRDHAEALTAMHGKYSARGVDFLVVYTKEQHPVGGWELQRNKDENISVPLAKTTADRQAAAEQLRNALKLPIALDSMDDETATKYGVGLTVPAYVIDRDGTIAFRQSWLETDALRRAIDDTLAAAK